MKLIDTHSHLYEPELNNHIGTFNSSIRPQSSHSDTDITQSQYRSIVHTISDKSGRNTGLCIQFFQVSRFIFRQ